MTRHKNDTMKPQKDDRLKYQQDDSMKRQIDMSYLLEVPVEMILLISEHLPSADAACLALACKATFTILHRNALQLDSEAKQSLLLRLEKEVPWLVYCPPRNKLLPFTRDGRTTAKRFCRSARRDGHPAFAPMTRSRHWAVISYERARLVRNYRLFGPGHGVPLSFLCHTATGLKEPVKFMQRLCERYSEDSMMAKWVGDELYLSCTRTIYVCGQLEKGQVNITALQDLIRERSTRICHHSAASHDPGALLYDAAILRDLPQICAKLSENSVYRRTGACKYCETDWDVSISWNDPKGAAGLVFSRTTYHNLGTCSSPLDPIWNMMASLAVYVDTRLSKRGGSGGYVKRRWIKAV